MDRFHRCLLNFPPPAIAPYILIPHDSRRLSDSQKWIFGGPGDYRWKEWMTKSHYDFLLQQTMLRIKDPKRSLEFYTRVLGMTLLQKCDFPTMKFSLYFLAYEDKNDIPKDAKEKTAWTFSRKATLELTHNWGTENDENQAYHNGNSDPRGFGHIGIAVPDVNAACKRFEELGVKFVKKPDDGKMKGLAFIQDPDGYWIEILNPNHMVTLI